MITGSLEPLAEGKHEIPNVDLVIHKPFSYNDLREALSQAVGKKNLALPVLL